MKASFGEGDEARDLCCLLAENDIATALRCGGGGFGEVFHLEHKLLGSIAIKRVRETGDPVNNKAHRRRARREARTWQDLNHPHILRFIGVYETEDHFYMVSPFAKMGSLVSYLRATPQADRAQLLTQTASALNYLHEKGIIHGDVKAANVLVSDAFEALLCDFGLARTVDFATSTAMQGQGSIRWLSPELLREGHGKTVASDVWAFGMLIYEVLSGLVPFHDKQNHAIYKALLIDGIRPPTSPSYSSLGVSFGGLWSIATICWNEDPNLRPSMGDIHPKLSHFGNEELPSHLRLQSPNSTDLDVVGARPAFRPQDSLPCQPTKEETTKRRNGVALTWMNMFKRRQSSTLTEPTDATVNKSPKLVHDGAILVLQRGLSRVRSILPFSKTRKPQPSTPSVQSPTGRNPPIEEAESRQYAPRDANDDLEPNLNDRGRLGHKNELLVDSASDTASTLPPYAPRSSRASSIGKSLLKDKDDDELAAAETTPNSPSNLSLITEEDD